MLKRRKIGSYSSIAAASVQGRNQDGMRIDFLRGRMDFRKGYELTGGIQAEGRGVAGKNKEGFERGQAGCFKERESRSRIRV